MRNQMREPIQDSQMTGKPETGTGTLGNFRVADHPPRIVGILCNGLRRL
jgi:hypothetical protein